MNLVSCECSGISWFCPCFFCFSTKSDIIINKTGTKLQDYKGKINWLPSASNTGRYSISEVWWASTMKRGKGRTWVRKTGSASVYVMPLFTVSLSACSSRGLGSHTTASTMHKQKNDCTLKGTVLKEGEHTSGGTTNTVWLVNLLSHLLMVPGMEQKLFGAGCPA